MAKINMNELTKEQIQKAMACETAEELMAVAKAESGSSAKPLSPTPAKGEGSVDLL